ncbi:MAG: T9SS type A sorting domain-containing protein [Balneolales bacterium]|nr:T9SS type A sorting domain-containing protein [Balneolales bacterium]
MMALSAQAQSQEEINDALRYYPLEVGNYWEYRMISMDGSNPGPADTLLYSREVVADTTLANGQMYKIIKSINRPLWLRAHYEYNIDINPNNQRISYYLERVDEENADIYQWNPVDSNPFNEVLIDSLLMSANSSSNAIRWPNGFGTDGWAEYEIELFGSSINSYHYNFLFLVPIQYTLSETFGLTHIHTGEGSIVDINLIYYRDNLGNEFGEPVFVNSPLEPELPRAASLSQNYPNPFNPSTQIPFELSGPAHVQLEVYDMLGRRVAVLINEMRQAGTHSARFEAGNLPSGMYITRMQTENEVFTQKMILLK